MRHFGMCRRQGKWIMLPKLTTVLPISPSVNQYHESRIRLYPPQPLVKSQLMKIFNPRFCHPELIALGMSRHVIRYFAGNDRNLPFAGGLSGLMSIAFLATRRDQEYHSNAIFARHFPVSPHDSTTGRNCCVLLNLLLSRTERHLSLMMIDAKPMSLTWYCSSTE